MLFLQQESKAHTYLSTNQPYKHLFRNVTHPYSEMRLKECGLTTLETRRLKGDQIEVFKILIGYENIDRNIVFTVKEERRTIGHGVTLAKKQCRL